MVAFTAPQELHDLAFRYALAVDNRDPAMLTSILTADGVVRGRDSPEARYVGAAGAERMIEEVSATFVRTMHHVFNQTFERADDGAVSGVTTGIASHLLPGDDGDLIDFAMRYHDRYSVEDGRWKFGERQLEVAWIERRRVERFSSGMLGRELRGFAPR